MNIISECIKKLEAIHTDVPSSIVRPAAAVASDASALAKEVTEWDKLLNKAQSFASNSGIATELASKRPMKTPQIPEEQAVDDRPIDPV